MENTKVNTDIVSEDSRDLGAEASNSDVTPVATHYVQGSVTQIEQPKSIFIWSNGAVSVFDKQGNQMPHFQISWLDLLLTELENKGVDFEQVKDFETVVNGRNVYIKPIKLEDGYNYSFSEF